MEPNETIEPTCYNFVYRHGVDEKRRLQIPAKWRPAIPGTELTLVIWPKAKEGPCIRVLPPAKLRSMMRDLEAMPNSDPQKPVLKRRIGSTSVQVTLDKSGRICLPEQTAKAAGITTEAVLVGVLDCFEIWSPEKYEQVEAADALLAQQAFQMLE
jgi:MraZ protein